MLKQCKRNVYAFEHVTYSSFASVAIAWTNPYIMGTYNFRLDAVNLDGIMVGARNVRNQG